MVYPEESTKGWVKEWRYWVDILSKRDGWIDREAFRIVISNHDTPFGECYLVRHLVGMDDSRYTLAAQDHSKNITVRREWLCSGSSSAIDGPDEDEFLTARSIVLRLQRGRNKPTSVSHAASDGPLALVGISILRLFLPIIPNGRT